eukprot:scaffold43159_cov39-Cyclotella_meneghiniana.AAC.1
MSADQSDTPESIFNQTSNGTPAARPHSPTFLNRVLTTAGTAINSIRRNTSPHDANSSHLQDDPTHANSSVNNRVDTPGINPHNDDAIRPTTPTFNPEGLFDELAGGIVNNDEDTSYGSSVQELVATTLAAHPSSPRSMEELEAQLSERLEEESIGIMESFLEAYPDIAEFIRDADHYLAAASRAAISGSAPPHQCH